MSLGNDGIAAWHTPTDSPSLAAGRVVRARGNRSPKVFYDSTNLASGVVGWDAVRRDGARLCAWCDSWVKTIRSALRATRQDGALERRRSSRGDAWGQAASQVAAQSRREDPIASPSSRRDAKDGAHANCYRQFGKWAGNALYGVWVSRHNTPPLTTAALPARTSGRTSLRGGT
jgi:hypothetical protein